MTLIFNHIPKTGGTSLRVILNKVYQPENVFFIKSKDIASSYKELNEVPVIERSHFTVISGHGATLFIPLIEKPYTITIIREPVSLFLSQYYYLKNSPNSNFLNEVSSFENIEEYLDYAMQKGQDNLLTRYLSGSMNWLIDPDIPIPNMDETGEVLLEKAKHALKEYNAVLDLKNFDRGIYALSQKLGWNKIPIYRPQNQHKRKNMIGNLSEEFIYNLSYTLRFDIELYNWFLNSKMDIAEQVNTNQTEFRLFNLRQKIINLAGKFIKR